MTDNTNSPPPATKCDITIDGERYDITNLLGALPETEDAKPPAAPAPVVASNRKSLTSPNRRSSLAKLSNKRSSHHYPQGLNLYGGSSHADDDDHSFSWDNYVKSGGAAKARDQRSGSISSMSSLSVSFHSRDCPGLTELQESASSFSDYYLAEQVAQGRGPNHLPYPNSRKSALAATATAAADDDECQEIEISPGVFLPFRGSEETWEAIQAGRACSVTCFDCSLELIAAQDCQHVVCPQCHTVNPIDMKDYDFDYQTTDIDHSIHFGVLMGFKKEWCGEFYDRVKQRKSYYHK